MTNAWRVAAAAVAGTRNEESGLPCEDAFAISEHAHSAADGDLFVNGAVLCDGAGSASRGRIGATIVSKLIAAWVVENFDLAFAERDEFSNQVATRAYRCLRRQSEKQGVHVAEFATTLMVVAAANDGRWLVLHLGDGAVVGRRNGELVVVSGPDNAEYANVTYFITDRQSHARLRLQTSATHKENDYDAFVLFSDGTGTSMIEKKTGRLAPAIATFCLWLEENKEQDVSDALHDTLQSMIRPKTSDDCSLALVVRARPECMED